MLICCTELHCHDCNTANSKDNGWTFQRIFTRHTERSELLKYVFAYEKNDIYLLAAAIFAL